jgi:HD-GYP domain-containing protein (c-di-GMP phosphodiesterase class II)
MLRVPRAIIDKTTPLTLEEKLEIQRHVFHGVNMLEKLRHIPNSTPYVMYQAHERMDGSGYPKSKLGVSIHKFAQLVAIADTYDAITSPRAFRGGLHPHTAMSFVVKQGSKQKLNRDAVRALLKYLGLFPIGSWVQISSGAIGKIVHAYPDDLDHPVIQLIGGAKEGKIKMGERLDLSKSTELKVTNLICSPTLSGEDSVMEGF